MSYPTSGLVATEDELVERIQFATTLHEGIWHGTGPTWRDVNEDYGVALPAGLRDEAAMDDLCQEIRECIEALARMAGVTS